MPPKLGLGQIDGIKDNIGAVQKDQMRGTWPQRPHGMERHRLQLSEKCAHSFTHLTGFLLLLILFHETTRNNSQTQERTHQLWNVETNCGRFTKYDSIEQ